MSTWTLTVVGRFREIYNVEADSEDEAREKFANGQVSDPFLTEIDDAEVQECEEVQE